MGRISEIVIILVIFGLLTLFTIMNLDNLADLNCFYWNGEFITIKAKPVIFYMMLSFGVGVLFSFLLATIEKIKKNREIRKLKKQLNKMEIEIKSLRNLPISEELQGLKEEETGEGTPPIG